MKKKSLLEIATELEASLDADGKGYNAKKAELFSVSFTPNGGLSFSKRSDNGDVYELLGNPFSVHVCATSDAIGVLTCGWAAPVDDDSDYDDLPPSVHPKRRRVRLLVCASRDGVASVLRFQDDPDNPITDEDRASGSLADAVHQLVAQAQASDN